MTRDFARPNAPGALPFQQLEKANSYQFHLGDELRLIVRRDDQDAEQQLGIERPYLEASVGARPGALAAIRIARRSKRADTNLWPGRVDEDRGIRERSPGIRQDGPGEIGIGRSQGRERGHGEQRQKGGERFHRLGD